MASVSGSPLPCSSAAPAGRLAPSTRTASLRRTRWKQRKESRRGPMRTRALVFLPKPLL
uniref:Uncharacterized protein n=1 Tax=Ursus americanus TaxID=9643 RepID=A0A452QTN8_URSAM